MGAGKIGLFGLAAVGALALGIGAAEVQQRYGDQIMAMVRGPTYDDPAVAVCEFTKLRGQEATPSEYSRKSAKFDGLTVTITYTTSPLNTLPQQHEYSCLFKVDDDGAFLLDRDLMKGTSECAETARALRTEIEAGASLERRNEIRTILDNCQKLIDDEQKVAFRILLDEDLALSLAGIYPIKPENTALRP